LRLTAKYKRCKRLAQYSLIHCYITSLFTTEDPKEAIRIHKAEDMAVCLWEITNNIRRRYLKYKDELTEEQLSVAEDIFADINHELDRWSINLDDLIE